MIVAIMASACYITRRRRFPITPPSKGQDLGLLGHAKAMDDDNLSTDSSEDQEMPMLMSDPITTSTTTLEPKHRSCCGVGFSTPNTSRYANYWHSRFIQKFPFLVEMFYWAINLLFYVGVKAASELIFATDGVWKSAENHAIYILEIEQKGPFSWLFPLREVDVQTWFRTLHPHLLTVLNRAYSLIHIPVTVTLVLVPLQCPSPLLTLVSASWPGTIMLRPHMSSSPEHGG